MKKCVVLMMLVAVTVITGAASAVMVKVEPASQQAQVNDQVTVDIYVSGLENTDLAAFDFDLSYDPAILTFVDYALTDQLGNIELFEAMDGSTGGDDSSGVVDLAVVSLLDDFSNQNSAFAAATVYFNAVDQGTSDLDLTHVDLGDSNAGEITAEVVGGSVTVVPEPASLLLSLAGLVMLRRNRS